MAHNRLYGLDGLRGVAALCVGLLHLYSVFGIRIIGSNASLAVDFFFVLSGYVIARNYGDNLRGEGLASYLRARAIRLFPLILLGAVLGAVSRLANGTDPLLVARIFPTAALSLPYFGQTPFYRIAMPLNGPGWSLFFELTASLAFGLRLWRRSGFVVAIAAILFGTFIVSTGQTDVGWTLDNLCWGFPRVAWGFGVGTWLYVRDFKVPHVHFGLLAVILAALLASPIETVVFRSACIFLFFPLIVTSAAGGNEWPRLCKVSGNLSYPFYIVHGPVYGLLRAVSDLDDPLAAFTGLLLALGTAAIVLKLYDLPVRRALTRHFSKSGYFRAPSVYSR